MSVSIPDAQKFFLVLTRTLAILSAVPVLGGRSIPPRVRLGFGILLALFLYSIASPSIPVEPTAGAIEPMGAFLWNTGRELMTGILAGMAIRLTFAALEAAARLMNDTIGFGAATLLNPTLDNPGTAFDQFYLMTAVLIFFITNGHHHVLRGLARTFEVVPLGTFALEAVGQESLLRLSAGMFVSAVQIALPIVAAMILLDVALGLVARAAPQMNVFFVGIPIKLAVGLLAAGIVLPMLIPAMSALFDNMIVQMARLIQ